MRLRVCFEFFLSLRRDLFQAPESTTQTNQFAVLTDLLKNIFNSVKNVENSLPKPTAGQDASASQAKKTKPRDPKRLELLVSNLKICLTKFLITRVEHCPKQPA